MTILRQLEFRIPLVPSSKKNAYRPNRQTPFRKANGSYHGKPFRSELKPQETAIRALLCAEMSRRGLKPLPKDQAVSVEIAVHEGPGPNDNYCTLFVFALGPRRKCGLKGSRPDLDGIVTTLLDAMNHAVFVDDRQVEKLHACRRAPGEPSQPWMPTDREIREAT